MTEVAMSSAKNRLSKLIDRVQTGEVILITRSGKVVAQLVLPEARDAAAHAQETIARLRASRKGVSPRGLNLRDLIAKGRR